MKIVQQTWARMKLTAMAVSKSIVHLSNGLIESYEIH